MIKIYSDMSMNPDTKVTGFAYSIHHPEHAAPLRFSGVTIDGTTCPDAAECQAITEAVSRLSRLSTATYKIEINTDSGNVHAHYNDLRTMQVWNPLKPYLAELRLVMMEHCLATGCSIRDVDTTFSLLHVVGHAGDLENVWCDKEAKRIRREIEKICLLK